MSVIVSRALPDVRDGFKPVHRRVLYAMNEDGNTYDKPTRKCASAVGQVMKYYHPHGDASIYGTLVRLAQPWNLRYPLVQGQGNFGSIDGDSPAAMRYTESRLNRLASEMIRDIDKDTVDFQNNFDDSTVEPTVLPARFPNLLVNGSAGIAVGMATNMAPHNLSESIDACVAYIDHRGDIDAAGLINYIKAPDFPTGGIIYGYAGVREAFETRSWPVSSSAAAARSRSTTTTSVSSSPRSPYQVNKSELVKAIADLINDKKIDGISGIADESTVRVSVSSSTSSVMRTQA